MSPNRGGPWTKNGDYGTPGPATKAVKAWKLPKIQNEAKFHGVPWPRATAKRAKDMSPHGVYQIYARDSAGKIRVYKYGITKNGASRPKSQLKRCAKVMGGPCQFDWLRTGVKGWFRARKVEAIHATKYKHVTGKCPPGMRRCL